LRHSVVTDVNHGTELSVISQGHQQHANPAFSYNMLSHTVVGPERKIYTNEMCFNNALTPD